MLAHATLIQLVEVGIKGYQNLFVQKCLPAEGYIAIRHLLLAKILELLSLHHVKIEITHIGSERQPSRIGKQDRGIVATLRHVIDHHVMEHTAILVLRLYEDVIARDLVIKCPLRYLQFGRFLLRREEECPHLHLRLGQNIILEEEGPDCHHRDEDDQRSHRLDQRYARSLDGGQLRFLTQIAEGHQTRQQDSQWERHRHHTHCCIKKQFSQQVDRQPFSHQVVDISPEKLHQHDEEHDEECHRELRQKTA